MRIHFQNEKQKVILSMKGVVIKVTQVLAMYLLYCHVPHSIHFSSQMFFPAFSTACSIAFYSNLSFFLIHCIFLPALPVFPPFLPPPPHSPSSSSLFFPPFLPPPLHSLFFSFLRVIKTIFWPYNVEGK